MQFHRLDLVDQGVESFEGLDEKAAECFLTINLQHNKVVNFERFGTHPYLTELLLQHNRIVSFRGLTKQASLKTLRLQGCPVASHPYYRLMALLTIGLGMEDVDGLPVTAQERHIAKSLGKRAALAVSYGWLLDLHPRTSDEYDAIISEFKRLRVDERRQWQGMHYVTVRVVLEGLSQRQQGRGYDASAEMQLAEKQQTITRLARRVAQLEGQLAEPPDGHVIPLLPPSEQPWTGGGGNGLSSSGGVFSAAELSQLDNVTFSHGIQMRHNLSLTNGGLQRVCLQLDHTSFTASKFLSRETLVQIPLRALRVRHLRPLSLIVEDDVGGMLGLQFDSLPLLHTVYKAIFVLSARPIPPLPAITQRQLEELEHAQRGAPTAIAAARPASSSAASDVEQSASWRSISERPSSSIKMTVKSKQAASQARTQSTTPVPPSEAFDNVSDVPPLPAAFSRVSTTGRDGAASDSISFSVDGSRPPLAPSDAGRGSAAASAPLEESGPAIEFHSAATSDRGSDARPAAAPQPPAPKPKAGGLFANLLVDSSVSSDSVAFQTDGDKSDGEDSVVMMVEEAAPAPASGAVPPPPAPPSKAPMVPRTAPAVPPRPPPPRKSQVNTPAPSGPPSRTQRSTAGAPPRPPSVGRSSLNSSIAFDQQSATVGGDKSISFRASEAGDSKAEASAKASTAGGAPPRVPSRFGALQVSSDSD